MCDPSFHRRSVRLTLSQPSTLKVPVESARLAPFSGATPIHLAPRTRRMCPCAKQATGPSNWTSSSIRASQRAPTCSGVSPPGLGWLHTVPPGTVLRMSIVVPPSSSPQAHSFSSSRTMAPSARPASRQVSSARERGLVKTTSKSWPARRSPSALACRCPFSVSGMSLVPVCRPLRLHSVSPCLARNISGFAMARILSRQGNRLQPPVPVATGTKLVYDFPEGSKEMRELLGGKGAGVAEMTRILGPERVPAGFTITTEACVAYMNAGQVEPEGLEQQVAEALSRLEEHPGKRLGDPSDPLLVSVRSGARESMPGMMDTVLNLGMSDQAVEGLARTTANERFAWDSYRRFVQMFGNVCRGVEGDAIERAIAHRKREAGVKLDTELGVEELKLLVQDFKALYRERTGEDFPQDPREQLTQAIRAVFDSWMGERAVGYRRINHIPDDWGTAVNVQQMVFGNKGDTS